MKSVPSRPAETILATRTTDPDWRMRTLHRLGKDRNVFDLEEFSGEIHRLVRPCLLNNLHPFDHPAGGFLLADTELSVLVRLAALAYAKIQPAVRNHVHHGVGLSDVEGIVQG